MLEVLILCVMVEVIVEAGVIDSVYVEVSVGAGKGFLEGVVLLCINSMDGIEVLRLVTGFGDGQSLSGPVDGRVYGVELSYPQNHIKYNSGSLLSHPPTLEHFCPASS